jgi:predicted ATP-dependent endonuclease of OLD family
MFKEITINGFRGLKAVSLKELGSVNLIVGQNNSGKTSILESLFLATNPGNPELPIRINQFRHIKEIDENSWQLLFCRQPQMNELEIVATLHSPPETRRLTIKPLTESIEPLAPQKLPMREAFSASSEAMSQINGLSLECDYETAQTQRKTTSWIRAKGEHIEKKHSEPEFILKALYLTPMLERHTLGTLLNEIQIRKDISKVVKVLQAIEPTVKDIHLGIDGNVLVDIGHERLIPLGAMGAGLIKVLAVISAMISFKNGIVLIDEIENGLHHTSQITLFKAIIEASALFKVQVFASTHSIESLSALKSAYQERWANDGPSLRLYRLEKKAEQFRVVDYRFETLAAAIDNSWEIR